MGNSVLEFESVGGHGCNREAKVGEEVIGCKRMGCPDCEAVRAVGQMLHAGVGTLIRARFVHWPGTSTEVVDEITWEPSHPGSSHMRLKVTRRSRDFFRNEEKAAE